MSVFDPYVALLREYESDLVSKGRDVRVWFADSLGVPIQTSGQAAGSLILKENTAVELGGPRTVGTSFAMFLEDPNQLFDGRITLVGSDVPDLSKKSDACVPFGQVILAAGPRMTIDIQPRLEREQYAAMRIPGYMVRGVGDRIWARISREACDSGFSFRWLGGAAISRILVGVAETTAVELIFVTSSPEDVAGLEQIGSQVRKLSHDLRRQRLKQVAEGVYECEAAISCDVCPDSPVCAEIRQILVIRKKADETRQT
jgi:CO dehydrogenase/acetyl-CoA synthase beta subunit